MADISPFAPSALPQLPEVAGVRLAACEAGIRYLGRKDLMLAVMDPGTTVAGVLTLSNTRSAPVDWCSACLPKGQARALVVNSGNANAFTGQKGHDAVATTVGLVSEAVGCPPEQVFVASTGVIGEPLDVATFADKLSQLSAAADPQAWPDVAHAIMTTDTYPKLATRTVELEGGDVTINGIAKGSGMIAPNMATMLAFIFTDASLAGEVLQPMVAQAADETFNAITVDGDTSTSDTVLAFATGAAAARGVAPINAQSPEETVAPFRSALEDLMRDLALQVVKDGEGLTKFVTINVRGAQSNEAARVIGQSIANSPLVKTAIAGEDPNWGRIVMAVGKAGEAADRARLKIWFGDLLVAEDGEVATRYREADGATLMKAPEIEITVDVGIAGGEATVWTCDLTARYVAINADYRS